MNIMRPETPKGRKVAKMGTDSETVTFSATKFLRHPGMYTIPLPEGWEFNNEDEDIARMWTTHPDGRWRRFAALYLFLRPEPWEPTGDDVTELMRMFVTEYARWEFEEELNGVEVKDGWPVAMYVRHQRSDETFGVDGPGGFPILWYFHVITGKWGYVFMEFAINDPENAEEASMLALSLVEQFKWAPEAEQDEAIREAKERLRETEAD